MDIVLSLGGSIIVPDEIDVSFIKKFRKLILGYIKKGNRVIIVAGGGHICRKYNKAANKISKNRDIDLDWIGIKATRLNAELIRTIFSKSAYEKVIENPTEKISTNKKIIIGSGWMPGCSSDKDAVLLAENLKVNTLINMSNIEYVYDKDPKKYKDAKPQESLTWNKLLEITGTEWKAGKNVPFDPEASKLAKKLGLKVVILDGTKLGNFKKFLEGKHFRGTTVS